MQRGVLGAEVKPEEAEFSECDGMSVLLTLLADPSEGKAGKWRGYTKNKQHKPKGNGTF